MDIILKTTALCKEFKEQTAVNNVSLNIQRNSVYGLLGPNGAGKSTILKMITGILRPTSGSIEFDGHPWNREDLGSIGALIEMPPLYENLSAYENLKTRTLALGLPESRIKQVLGIVQLENTGKKRAGHFSLGMKQRLGIALALLSQPKLLILDEPTNGLDPIGIQDLRELIRSFPQKGITVILSSHILSEVEQIADHIGIISAGHLGYESEIHMTCNLERIFMDVVGAHISGISARHIANVEKGDVNPSFEVLSTLVKALGVSFDAIFDPADEQTEADIQEIAGLYRACPEQGRRLILASTRAMAHELMDANIE